MKGNMTSTRDSKTGKGLSQQTAERRHEGNKETGSTSNNRSRMAKNWKTHHRSHYYQYRCCDQADQTNASLRFLKKVTSQSL
ncbi:hypothetical protein OIU84_028323, partial [Salix udensis]